MTLTTSVACVLTLIPACIRWLRSPKPVSVGVNTRWPFAVKRSVTRRQHQPPCQAPWTRTKVVGAGAMTVPRLFSQPVDKWESVVFPDESFRAFDRHPFALQLKAMMIPPGYRFGRPEP